MILSLFGLLLLNVIDSFILPAANDKDFRLNRIRLDENNDFMLNNKEPILNEKTMFENADPKSLNVDERSTIFIHNSKYRNNKLLTPYLPCPHTNNYRPKASDLEFKTKYAWLHGAFVKQLLDLSESNGGERGFIDPYGEAEKINNENRVKEIFDKKYEDTKNIYDLKQKHFSQISIESENQYSLGKQQNKNKATDDSRNINRYKDIEKNLDYLELLKPLSEVQPVTLRNKINHALAYTARYSTDGNDVDNVRGTNFNEFKPLLKATQQLKTKVNLTHARTEQGNNYNEIKYVATPTTNLSDNTDYDKKKIGNMLYQIHPRDKYIISFNNQGCRYYNCVTKPPLKFDEFKPLLKTTQQFKTKVNSTHAISEQGNNYNKIKYAANPTTNPNDNTDYDKNKLGNMVYQIHPREKYIIISNNQGCRYYSCLTKPPLNNKNNSKGSVNLECECVTEKPKQVPIIRNDVKDSRLRKVGYARDILSSIELSEYAKTFAQIEDDLQLQDSEGDYWS